MSDFKMLPLTVAQEMLPSGLHDWKRVPLYVLFPQLGKLPLGQYWQLRVACCAHLLVSGADKVYNCDRCYLNRGYVCPECLGARWQSTLHMASGMVMCPGCTVPYLDEKGKPAQRFEPQKELETVRAWFMKHFMFGVPHTPTADDLYKMGLR